MNILPMNNMAELQRAVVILAGKIAENERRILESQKSQGKLKTFAEPEQTPNDDLQGLIEKRMSEAKLAYGAAFSEVVAEHPDLYAQHVQSVLQFKENATDTRTIPVERIRTAENRMAQYEARKAEFEKAIKHHPGGPENNAALKIHNMAHELLMGDGEGEGELGYVAAQEQVIKQNPDLYAEYRRQATLRARP